jgi:hypothetical protein
MSTSTMSGEGESTATWRIALGYALMLVVSVGLIVAVLAWGSHMSPAATAANEPRPEAAAHHLDALYHVLLCLVLILLLGRWMGKLCLYLGQPRVIGEMVAGIMLGPSLLGHFWPAATEFILPEYAAVAQDHRADWRRPIYVSHRPRA